MIPSVLPTPALLAGHRASAHLQCALYFELLRLAGRVLRQYTREHLSQP